MMLLLLLLSLVVPAWAQSPSPTPDPSTRAEYIRSHYAKFEYRIPMRDGIKLFTAVYLPNEALTGKTYPILMERTPYSVGPYGVNRYASEISPTQGFEEDGFIFVLQDVRGRYMSEGQFKTMRPCGQEPVDESTDTYDTISWLLAHVPHHNGKVGMWGVSYPGFYAASGAVNSHPALKAVSPQAPIANWWRGDDTHRNGAFNLQLAYSFFAYFGHPRPEPVEDSPKPYEFKANDAYAYFMALGPLARAAAKFGFPNWCWEEMVQHPNYDEFWQARNLVPHLKSIRSNLMIVGGWFDTEDLFGPLHIYAGARKLNPSLNATLVMGPWWHGGWLRGEGEQMGDADFGFKTSLGFQPLLLAWFKQQLKGSEDAHVPGALVFETGANRWRSFPSWPPAGTHPATLYLGAHERLESKAGNGFDEFPSDPNKPVPYTEDFSSIRWNKNYMAEDQRYAARRPDVLVFQGEPLKEDLTVAGPIGVDLWVSTSASDADWVVKLIDVNPSEWKQGGDRSRGDQQTLVRGEPFRGRFRDDPSHPRPFVSGQATRVHYQLNDVFHTFARGHRVMVQVQSSWFPFIDRNPQKYVANIFEAGPDDFIKAVHRVYHNSSIVVNVLQ